MSFDEEMLVNTANPAGSVQQEKKFRKTATIGGLVFLFVILAARTTVGGMAPMSAAATVGSGLFDRQLQTKGGSSGGGNDGGNNGGNDGGDDGTSEPDDDSNNSTETPDDSDETSEPVQLCNVTYYTASDVSGHSTVEDCWIILSDTVYNLTSTEVLQKNETAAVLVGICGMDATVAYKTNLTEDEQDMVDDDNYIVGILGNTTGVQEVPCDD